jgi:hypothetical protein
MDDNEHLEDIMPVLYKIVSEVRRISEAALGQITKVYITGLGTAINNIDLYFQEYIPNSKCELLKPFFLENSSSIKVPIKDYIEVNSAIALALDGLGYGEPELNFRGKKSLGINTNIDAKTIEVALRGLLDPKKELTAIDKTMLRALVVFLILVIGYSGFSMSISKQIDEKQEAVASASQKVDSQISIITEQNSKISTGTRNYEQVVTALTTVDEPTTSGTDYTIDDEEEDEVEITKYAIPNLLNRIVQTIPQQVKITSIKNTTSNHIVIQAQASKYDQLGYFRAVLSTDGILENVKSTSGSKSGETVTITIEGDLP